MIFLALLAAAGVRATPSVLIVPLEQSFGWTRATISLAISINIFLYGLMGPFAAALMQRIGIRRTVASALALMAATVAASTFITAPWQLIATWGFLIGLTSGTVALVLGAAVVNRWFVTRRGLVMGILTASTATGQLVFLPMLASVSQTSGWQPVAWITACVAAAMVPLVLIFVRDNPADVGLRAYGADSNTPPPAQSTANPIVVAFAVLARASRSRDFWLLFLSFFVCGLSTNGLDRHASDRRVLRPGHPGSARCQPAGDDGHLRPDRHHPVGLAVRPLRQSLAAVLVLRPARRLADLPPVLRLHSLRARAVRGLLWTGLDRDGAAHACASSTTPSASTTRR